MSGFLSNIIDRNINPTKNVKPRQQGIFESHQNFAISDPLTQQFDHAGDTMLLTGQTLNVGLEVDENPFKESMQESMQQEETNYASILDKQTPRQNNKAYGPIKFSDQNSPKNRTISKKEGREEKDITIQLVKKNYTKSFSPNPANNAEEINEADSNAHQNKSQEGKENHWDDQETEKIKPIQPIHNLSHPNVSKVLGKSNTRRVENPHIQQNEKHKYQSSFNGERPPVVKISIGRIEVKATTQSPNNAAKPKEPVKSSLSLDQFLKKRGGKSI